MGLKVWGVALVTALTVALTCGSALAAPPTDPPGKSGEAPGQAKKEANQYEAPLPGHAKHEDQAQAAIAEVVVPAAEPEAPAPTRFMNASDKPKVNVPPAAEAAPQTSISAPGRSGRHKLTICHKGHAITVDVHAARAHVDGHGDTYAVAGAKGRAACPHTSGAVRHEDPPAGPRHLRPKESAAVAGVSPGAAAPAVEPAAADPPGAVKGGRERPGRVVATANERRGAVAGAVDSGSLPFTGWKLGTLVLLGFGLLAAGLALVAASRTPLRRATSSDQARSRT